MNFKRIDHVSLQVRDVRRSVAFYEQLGFKKIKRPDFGFDGAWLQICNNYQLHLLEGLGTSVNSGNRSTHFAIAVNDLEKFSSELDQQRIQHGPIKVRPDGISQLFVEDPDGYFWEFNNANN